MAPAGNAAISGRICRLCRLPKVLRASHILPELLYKKSYDEKHRAIFVNLDRLEKKLIQKGIREKLLSDDCEGILSKLETRFAADWRRLRPMTLTAPLTVVNGLDYATFKLFHLSILWRASESSLPEFEKVKLGPLAERIRPMLLEGDLARLDDYSFWAAGLVWPDSGEFVDEILMAPQRARIDGHTFYVTAYGGCGWYFCMSRGAPPKMRISAAFSKAGELAVVRTPFEEWPPVRAVAPGFREIAARKRTNQGVSA